MPMIRVEMLAGRTREQKKALVREITEGTCRALGCKPDAVQIVLSDIARDDWAESGKLFSET